MRYEFAVSLSVPLRGVVFADPLAPLPSPPVAAPPEPVIAATPAPEPVDSEERQLVERVLANLTDAAQELHAQQQQRLEEMQQAAVELAVAIASRLVHDRIATGDFAVESLVRQVVERLEPNQPVSVYLHPEDLSLLEKRLGEERAVSASGAELRLTADATLTRGDCRAETGDACVLARLEEQLADIRRHLLQSLPEATVERRRHGPLERSLRRFPERRQTA